MLVRSGGGKPMTNRSFAHAVRTPPDRWSMQVTQAPAHAISVQGLHVYYGTVHALKGISLKIKTGQVTALIGPSGCGKSTFLRTLNRMNDLTEAVVAGSVFVLGENIYSPQVDVVELRRRVGMVFQTPNPFPKSIFENVVFGLRRQGIKDRRVLAEVAENSLKRAALWDEVKDRLHDSALTLSGGQQQRLCIARALALEPKVLLMDEPASALDPVATAKIEQLIMDLKGDYTIVIVTHNMQQAVRVSDETAFFLNGELIEMASTRTLFTQPADRRTEDYISGRFG